MDQPALEDQTSDQSAAEDDSEGRPDTVAERPPLLLAEGDAGQIVAPDPETLKAADNFDAYRAMSAADERQIAQELEGKAVKGMLYKFDQGGQAVIGLSWIGVREAVRQVNTRGYGRISVSESTRPEFENVMLQAEIGQNADGSLIYGEVPGIRCTIFAADELHGGGNWGTATQTRDQVMKGGKSDGLHKNRDENGYYAWRPDPFSATKALSKAQRNALEPFIPLFLVEELKTLYLGKGQVEYIESTAVEIDDRPAALTDDRAKAQMDRCREIYDEIKRAKGPKFLTPAKFNVYMNGCQHDHDRLDEMIAHLESLLEQKEETAA